MGDRLTDALLLEATVPGAWAPLLALLVELEARLPLPGPVDPAARAAARPLHARLLDEAARLAETAPPQLRPESPEHRRWFTEAALLWTHFAAAGGRTLVDSHRSGTLAAFTPDLPAEDDTRPAAAATILGALQRTFAWSDEALAHTHETIQRRISNLGIKNAIAARLAAELDGAPGSPALADQMLRLFQRLYGPLPLRPGDVDVTLTSTTLIFGLPFTGTTFLRPDFAARPAPERAAVEVFLAAVDKHMNSFDTLRFPGFGLYDRGHVDPTLVAALTTALAAHPGWAEIPARVVSETLATMVTVVPSQDADMFLIHDIWGHGWEESLGDFEWTYARLIELREPVQAMTGPRFGGEGTPALRAAFGVQDGRVVLDPALFRRVVEADLRGRITIGLNVVVAESLADLVEHKYGRRRAAGDPPLPSSSLFPGAPLKIDLSLKDTQSLLKATHRSYRRLLAEPAEAARLAAELRAGGLPDAGLAEAIADALALIRQELGHVFDTAMRPAQADADGQVRVNLAQRVMLGMLALAATLGRFLDEADADARGDVQADAASASSGAAAPRWRHPRTCIDLIVLLLGWFYEQDRSLHFWHLDELLRTELRPTLDRFERELALERDPARGPA